MYSKEDTLHQSLLPLHHLPARFFSLEWSGSCVYLWFTVSQTAAWDPLPGPYCWFQNWEVTGLLLSGPPCRCHIKTALWSLPGRKFFSLVSIRWLFRQQDHTESIKQISTKLGGCVSAQEKIKTLTFGADLDKEPDPGFSYLPLPFFFFLNKPFSKCLKIS